MLCSALLCSAMLHRATLCNLDAVYYTILHYTIQGFLDADPDGAYAEDEGVAERSDGGRSRTLTQVTISLL